MTCGATVACAGVRSPASRCACAMPVAVLHSRALSGLDAPPVTVEVHLAGGLPAFNLVGLPDTEVKESRERVRAALQNAQFEFPARKITVNLAPADLPKESGRFDLPIAIGILAATGQVPASALALHEFAGELALGGALRSIRGALADGAGGAPRRPRVRAAGSQCGRRRRSCAMRSCILPRRCWTSARISPGASRFCRSTPAARVDCEAAFPTSPRCAARPTRSAR